MARTEIMGVGFDPVTMDQAQAEMASYALQNASHLVVTANPEMVMRARGDQLLAEILARADLVVADGIGVVWASRMLQKAVPERIPGIELAEGLLCQAAQEGWTVFLLGAAEGVARQAATKLQQRLPGLKIVGTHHGYFQAGPEEDVIIQEIQEKKPHILLVALGVPRAEKWLAAHLGTMKVSVAMGVGGSFNVWAGVDRRAPLWMRNIHLEWLYRLIRQPWRIKRLLVLPVFVLLVLVARFKSGR